VIITQSTQTLCGHNAHTLCYVSQAVYCSPECQDERTLIRKSENDNSRRKTETCSWKLSVCLSAPLSNKNVYIHCLVLGHSICGTDTCTKCAMDVVHIYIYIYTLSQTLNSQTNPPNNNNNNNNNNKTKQLVQTVLRIKFWSNKLRVNAGYVSNMKKLLTT